jgi:hypothetical protein
MPHFNGSRSNKEAKQKKVKPVKTNEMGYCDLQYSVPKGVEDDKRIKPSQVFVGFKDNKQNNKKSHNKNKKSK